MSLRRRFLLLSWVSVVLGVVALALAFQLRADSSSAREAAAFDEGERIVDALSRADGAAFDDETQTRARLAQLIAPLVDASAGTCGTDGQLRWVETVAPIAFAPTRASRPDGPFDKSHAFFAGGRPHLLPLDRDAVEGACRSASVELPFRERFAAPNDLLFVVARRRNEREAVFALVRMPNRAGDRPSTVFDVTVGALIVGLLLVVGLCLDALRAVRQGTASLATSFQAVRSDLHASVPTPSTEELAGVAEDLRALSATLVSSLERERTLERRLGHEARLIGLGRVVAGVAHEVRNPLTAVKLKLDGLKRRALDERSATDVAICLREIERLDSVVRSLLLVSRRGHVAYVGAPVDVAGLVLARCTAVQHLVERAEVSLVLSGQGTASVDPTELGGALENLVRNAIEASPRGGTVWVDVRTADDRATEIVVRDEGAGVPDDVQPRLFEPFFSSKPSGTGLGLALARATVEVAGGTLEYRPGAGGACFVVRLPTKEGPG